MTTCNLELMAVTLASQGVTTVGGILRTGWFPAAYVQYTREVRARMSLSAPPPLPPKARTLRGRCRLCDDSGVCVIFIVTVSAVRECNVRTCSCCRSHAYVATTCQRMCLGAHFIMRFFSLANRTYLLVTLHTRAHITPTYSSTHARAHTHMWMRDFAKGKLGTMRIT